jgi:hypothetical protein
VQQVRRPASGRPLDPFARELQSRTKIC